MTTTIRNWRLRVASFMLSCFVLFLWRKKSKCLFPETKYKWVKDLKAEKNIKLIEEISEYFCDPLMERSFFLLNPKNSPQNIQQQ